MTGTLFGVQALHSRMEPLLLFFVDGASHIDPEEAAWDLLVARRLVNGQPMVVSPDGQESAQAQLPRCCTGPEHAPRQQQPIKATALIHGLAMSEAWHAELRSLPG